MTTIKQYFSIFKIPYFSFLFIGSTLTNIGQSAMNISLIWFIYEYTKNPFFITLALLSLELPSIFISPLIGFILDKYNVTKIIFLANLSRAILFIILYFIELTTVLDYVLFFTTLIISSSILPLSKSGEFLIISKIIQKENLVAVNSLMNIQFDLALVIGPLISVAFTSTLGERTAFLANSVFLILSAIFYLFIRIEHTVTTGKQNQSNWASNIFVSLKFIYKEKIIALLTLIFFLWNLLIWGTSPVLTPIFSSQYLNGIGSYTSITAILSFGIILGSFLCTKIDYFSNNILKMTLISISMHAFLYTFVGFFENITLLLIMFFLMGVISAFPMIYTRTLFQILIPKENQGSFFTLIGSLGTAGYPLGSIIASQYLIINNNSLKTGYFIFGGVLFILSVIGIAVFKGRSSFEKN